MYAASMQLPVYDEAQSFIYPLNQTLSETELSFYEERIKLSKD